MTADRKRLLCLGTTDYAEIFFDTHAQSPEFEFCGFLENLTRSRCTERIAGLPIHWSDEADALSATHWITAALATTLRKSWIEDLHRRGFRSATLVHPDARVSTLTELAPGVSVDPGCVLAGRSRIGHAVRIGRLCAIGHHLEVGAFSTIHPSATLSGGCRIGSQVMIGTGATVSNDVEIGDGAVIAVGSVVTRDVPPRALVRGNPARVLKHDYGPR